MNCWEFTHCGRESAGSRAAELGICPAALCGRANGIHYGTNAGRACWAVDGTQCDGTAPRSSEEKIRDCMRCAFFTLVHQEESACLISIPEIRSLIYG